MGVELVSAGCEDCDICQRYKLLYSYLGRSMSDLPIFRKFVKLMSQNLLKF